MLDERCSHKHFEEPKQSTRPKPLRKADSTNYKKGLIQSYNLQLKKKRPLSSNAERSKMSKVEEQVWKEVEKDNGMQLPCKAAQSTRGTSASKAETLETLSSSNTGLKRRWQYNLQQCFLVNTKAASARGLQSAALDFYRLC